DQSLECILEFRSQAGNLEKTKPTPFRSGWSGRVFFCEILECCARLELHLEARSLLFSVHCDQAQADTLGFSSCRRHGSNSEDQQKKAQNASSDNDLPLRIQRDERCRKSIFMDFYTRAYIRSMNRLSNR